MSMYNLIDYSDNYSKSSGSLWHYYRDEPFLNANGAIDDFVADNNNSASFKFKIDFIPTWSNKFFITNNPTAGHEPTFTITDAKVYVTVVTLSNQDNEKLLQ